MDDIQTISVYISLVAAASAAVSAFVAFLVYHRSKSPIIIAYIEVNEGILRFAVENIGYAPALDIRIRIDGKYLYDSKFEHLLEDSFINRGIAVLVPAAKRSTVLGQAAEYATDREMPVAKVSYKSPVRILPVRTRAAFKLDWASFSGSLYLRDTRTEMEKAVTKAAEKYLKEN